MIYIQDRLDNTLGAVKNPYDDEFYSKLAQGLSTFQFTISKSEEVSQDVVVGNLVVKSIGVGIGYQFTIITVEETHDSKVVYCEDIGLTLINKTAGAWDLPEKGKSIAQYIKDATGTTKWEIGINEIGDEARIYSWEQSDTALKRILDIADKFGAELEFTVRFQNLTVTKKIINVYKKRGAVRTDVQLVYGDNVNDIKKKADITTLATALRGVGAVKDVKGYDITKEDPNKFSIKYKEGYGVMALDSLGNNIPNSNKRFLTSSTWDFLGYKWCGKFFCLQASSTEFIPLIYTNHAVVTINYVNNYGVNAWDKNGDQIAGTNKKFKAGSNWKVSEIVEVNGSRLYKVSNTEYIPVIYSQFGEGRTAKATYDFSELAYKSDDFYTEVGSPILYANTANAQFNHSDEYIEQDFAVDSTSPQVILDKTLEELKSKSVMKASYEVELSQLDSSLRLGDEIRVIDHDYKPALYLTARLSEIKTHESRDKDTAVFTNFVERKSSITKQLSDIQKYLAEQQKLVNNFVWIRYADDDLGTGLSAFPAGKKYMAVVYSQVTNVPSDDPADYAEKWVLIKGADGEDGVAGKDGVGVKATAITYAQSTSGTTPPTTGWAAGVPTLIKGQYLWTKTVWTYTDSSAETGYTVSYNAKDGNNGSDGIAGKDGVGISATKVEYAGSTSGTTKPTSGWASTVPSVAAGSYLWTKTTWSYTDGTSESGYSVAKMGEKGDKGDTGVGIAGKPGADGKTPYFHIAYANSADGKDGFYVGGGTNLLTNTSSSATNGQTTMQGASASIRGLYSRTDSYEQLVPDTSYNEFFYRFVAPSFSNLYGLIPGETYTLSGAASHTAGKLVFRSGYSTDGSGWSEDIIDSGIPVSDESVFTPFSYTFTIPVGATGVYFSLQNYDYTDDSLFRFKNMKLEKGSKATPWTPAPSEAHPIYMGIYTDFTQADSLDPSAYSWAQAKGDKGDTGVGIAGTPGKDGKTPYVHTAWSRSSDGVDGFSNSYPGENLIMASEFDRYWSMPSTATIVDGYDGHKAVHIDTTTWTSGFADVQQPIYNADVQFIKSGEWYTISFDAKGKGFIRTHIYPSVVDTNAGAYVDGVFLSGDVSTDGMHEWTLTDEYIRHSWSFMAKTPLSPTTNEGKMLFRTMAGNSTYASLPKLEQGISATPWYPSSTDDPINAYPSYRGEYTDYTEADSDDPTKYEWALIRGANGNDGLPGKDGLGIKSTVIAYQLSSSGTTTPTGTWSATVPTLTKGQYLWTRTDWTYTDGTAETGYSVSYIAKDGNNGTDGIAGKDGVGIKTTTITYQSGASGTVQPTGIWVANPPSVPGGQYLWTRTTWTYTDNTIETGYSVGKIGETGPKGDPGQPGKDGEPGSKDVPVTTVSAAQPATAKDGDIWWVLNSTDVATAMKVYTSGAWVDKKVDQSVLNIVTLNAVEINGSTINGSEFNISYTGVLENGQQGSSQQILDNTGYSQTSTMLGWGGSPIVTRSEIDNTGTFRTGYSNQSKYNPSQPWANNIGSIYINPINQYILFTATGLSGDYYLNVQDAYQNSGSATYLNGWGSWNADYSLKVVRKGRMVTVWGYIKHNNSATITPFAQVPAWARPQQGILISAVTFNSKVDNPIASALVMNAETGRIGFNSGGQKGGYVCFSTTYVGGNV